MKTFIFGKLARVPKIRISPVSLKIDAADTREVEGGSRTGLEARSLHAGLYLATDCLFECTSTTFEK